MAEHEKQQMELENEQQVNEEQPENPENKEQVDNPDPQGSDIDENERQKDEGAEGESGTEQASAPSSGEVDLKKALEERDRKIEQLEAELEEARRTAEENYQKWLRAQADFDNFRKRTRTEKEEMQKYASLSVIEKLLPCMDNFERALTASRENPDFDSLLKGLEMIYAQMNKLLEEEEVKPIEAVGTPFNPEYHQAVMQVESEEHEEGIVVEEMLKGYMLKDKVIRPSMVKVSK